MIAVEDNPIAGVIVLEQVHCVTVRGRVIE